jgi:hypothetical protein
MAGGSYASIKKIEFQLLIERQTQGSQWSSAFYCVQGGKTSLIDIELGAGPCGVSRSTRACLTAERVLACVNQPRACHDIYIGDHSL